MNMELYSRAKQKSAAQTLSDICASRPALASVLSAFIPLYEAREAIPVRLVGLLPAAVAESVLIQPERQAQGVPLLAEAPLGQLEAAFKAAASELLPLLAMQEFLTEPVAMFLQVLDTKKDVAAKLMEACLRSNATSIKRIAKQMDIAAPVLVFLTLQVLGPVLQAVRMAHTKEHEYSSWREGYCPVCGSFPSVGYLDRPDPDQSEFMKGGGGHKYLHCSLCGQDWRFRRGACPACSNEEPGAIEYLRSPETPSERIEFCSQCNTYVSNVDMRETIENPNLDAAALGMMHLDLLAAEKGLHPLAPSFWNSFE